MLWQHELRLCPWRQWMQWRAPPGPLSPSTFKTGRSAPLPREPSGGRKRQDTHPLVCKSHCLQAITLLHSLKNSWSLMKGQDAHISWQWCTVGLKPSLSGPSLCCLHVTFHMMRTECLSLELSACRLCEGCACLNPRNITNTALCQE